MLRVGRGQRPAAKLGAELDNQMVFLVAGAFPMPRKHVLAALLLLLGVSGSYAARTLQGKGNAVAQDPSTAGCVNLLLQCVREAV
jgi:hypothetical protein